MNLYNAIKETLITSSHALTIDELITKIKTSSVYDDIEGSVLNYDNITSYVWKYSDFEYVNGLVFLSSDGRLNKITQMHWSLVESLRGIHSQSDILFITAILLFDKRLFDLKKQNDDIKITDLIRSVEFFANIDQFDSSSHAQFDNARSLISKLNNQQQYTLNSTLSLFDTSCFTDTEFACIYEYLTYEQHSIKNSGSNLTPQSVINTIAGLVGNIKNKESIYDPVAGFGGLLSRIALINHNSKELVIEGSEINKQIDFIANLAMYLHGYNKQSIRTEDCFENITNNETFDYVVGDLPINGITTSFANDELYWQYNIEPPKSQTSRRFNSLVLLSYSRLSYFGKATITVSDSFLTKGGKDKEVRKLLIDEDAIETVISLPKGTYRPYTESKASILILNKNKESFLRGQVRFIQASIIEENKKSVLLNVDEVLKQYEGKYSNKGVEIVKYEALEDGDNLSADLYLSQFFKSKELVNKGTAKYLKNLVEIKMGIQPKPYEISKEGVPLVKIENLHRNILGIELIIDDISSFVQDGAYPNKLITEDCILIARIGDSLKPTIFKYKSTPILYHSNVVVLTPRKDIDIDYLYYQLSSRDVEEQVHSLTGNALIPFLNGKKIGDIVIPILNLRDQKKWVEEQTSILISEESKRLEQTKLLLGYKEQAKEAEINTVRIITHQLKHNLTDLTIKASSIKTIIGRHKIGSYCEYDLDNPILQQRDGYAIPQNKSLKEFSEELLEKAISLEEILISIKQIVDMELIFKDENIYNLLDDIKQAYRHLSIEVTGNDDCVLSISKYHIKDLFDTLVKNALKHSQLNESKLKISFSIKRDAGLVLIEYKNNGVALDISSEEYKAILTKSRTSDGDGIGGFYIDQIIKKHNGKFSITENLTKGVKMTITLPIINTNEE